MTLTAGSLAAEGARGCDYTVGPGGTHATVQTAIDTATAGNVASEICLRAQTFHEALTVSGSFAPLVISGGWNAGYDEVEGRTTIDADELNRVLTVTSTAQALDLFDLDLIDGLSSAGGGGVRLVLAGTAAVLLERVLVADNEVTTLVPGAVSGGGLYAELGGSSTLTLRNVAAVDNRVTAADFSTAAGGGLRAYLYGSASLTMEELVVIGNVLQNNSSQVTGAGVEIQSVDLSSFVWRGREVRGNRTEGVGAAVATGSYVSLSGGSTGEIRRVLWTENLDLRTGGGLAEQVAVSATSTAQLLLTDSQIDSGNGSGLFGFAADSAVLNATNLTIAANALAGVMVATGPDLIAWTLYNTIVFGNNPEMIGSGPLDSGSNLVGIDPLFLSTLPGTFRIGPSSPARDSGDAAPPGGLGSLDLTGQPRVAGATVDRGAHELQTIFADGFESGSTSAWSTTAP